MGLKRPRIATLESFIIDTFTRVEADGTEVNVDKPDQIGGAGVYGIMGARIFLPASRLAMIVDYTPASMPVAMREALDSYGSDMWAWRERTDGNPTTRAVNRYREGVRGFEYLSPPLLLSPRALQDIEQCSPLPEWLHLVSFPGRAMAALNEISAMNGEVEGGWRPGLLWEPEPPACVPENWNVIGKIAPRVDVLSPNHTEALNLLDKAAFQLLPREDLVPALEWAVRRLVALRPRLGVVIRAGALGSVYSLSAERVRDSADAHPVYWAPAYWQPDMPEYTSKVVDPTGAGNAFMGGLMAALDEGKGLHEAVVWGNVSASFIIEQHGLPSIKTILGREVWNGGYAWERVDELKRRMEV